VHHLTMLSIGKYETAGGHDGKDTGQLSRVEMNCTRFTKSTISAVSINCPDREVIDIA